MGHPVADPPDNAIWTTYTEWNEIAYLYASVDSYLSAWRRIRNQRLWVLILVVSKFRIEPTPSALPPALNASWSPLFDVSVAAVSSIEFWTPECGGKQLNMLNPSWHTKEHCNLSCCPNTRHANFGNTVYCLICHMLNLIYVNSCHLFLYFSEI
jgi:hypothetical protein